MVESEQDSQLMKNRMYLVDGILDVVGTAGCDVRVQWLILGRQRPTIFVPNFTFLHRPLATNDYRCARLAYTTSILTLVFQVNLS